MTIRSVALALIFVGVAAGCAKPLYWYRPTGATREEAARDRYECTQQSRTPWSGGGTGQLGLAMMALASSQAEEQSKQLFVMCMQARGWDATTNLAEAQRLHGSGPRGVPAEQLTICPFDNWNGTCCKQGQPVTSMSPVMTPCVSATAPPPPPAGPPPDWCPPPQEYRDGVCWPKTAQPSR
jgi:hypothetical protein